MDGSSKAPEERHKANKSEWFFQKRLHENDCLVLQEYPERASEGVRKERKTGIEME